MDTALIAAVVATLSGIVILLLVLVVMMGKPAPLPRPSGMSTKNLQSLGSRTAHSTRAPRAASHNDSNSFDPTPTMLYAAAMSSPSPSVCEPSLPACSIDAPSSPVSIDCGS
jgi:hypothetical protein